MTNAVDYGAIKKYVEAAMYDIVTRKQVEAAKHDILTRLAPKDKITEKLGDCGNGPQHISDDYDSDTLPEDDELCPFDYSYLNKNNSQSGENDVGGEDKPTAEEKYFYGW